MNALRVATIGAWGHVDKVLRQMAGMGEGVQWVACSRATPEEDLSVLSTFHHDASLVPVFENPLRMLEESKPQVVIVSARLDRIAPLALKAVEAGCHVICEKPLALTHETLGVLRDAVESAGVQCVAMLDNRAHPVLAAARNAIQAGMIGEIVLCNARKSYPFGNRPAWFANRAQYGGTIPWIGIHALDFVQTVTGSFFTAVAAMHGNSCHAEWPQCEDHAALLLELENGSRATVSLDYLRPAKAPTRGDDWIRVAGSRGG